MPGWPKSTWWGRMCVCVYAQGLEGRTGAGLGGQGGYWRGSTNIQLCICGASRNKNTKMDSEKLYGVRKNKPETTPKQNTASRHSVSSLAPSTQSDMDQRLAPFP